MKPLLPALLLLSAISASAQSYWQQHVATKLDVRLDDKEHFLHAREEFVYTNNSPDTLKSLYIHLWPNAYKHDHTPFAQQQDRQGSKNFYYSKPWQKGYIDSLDFMVEGQQVEHFIAENTPDIARIDLPKSLLPGQSIKVSTPFRVKIPTVFSRMGHTGQAYFISQWFPKPAVYDSKGWHPLSYLDQGEFYSEFGSYDVTITVPRNYVVMATGNCMDDKENLWLDSLSRLSIADSVYKGSDTTPVSSQETKTLHFYENNIHDFAWFADKRWIVRKDSVVSPGNNHLVYTYTAFLPSYKKKWARGNEYLGETIKYYGKWVGPYPYNTIKAVLGDMHAGGGMEYPTVTIIDKAASGELKTVVVHEAGHNWFYGMLGSNEREHPWMDEGLNTFYEKKTTKELRDTGKSRGVTISADERVLYGQNVATSTDQGIDQVADQFTRTNYGVDVYYKTGTFLRTLEKYMGEADFEKGMHLYYDRWHHKHPYPDDFRACMEESSSKLLKWFFDEFFFTDKRMDFKVTRAHTDEAHNSTEVRVHNNGNVTMPVLVDAYRKDTLLARVWTEPFKNNTTVSLPVANWDKIRIDSVMPDAKTANNVYRRYGLSHNFSLRLKPLLGLNMIEHHKVFLSPAVGYNQYDGIMAGLLFQNIATVPENRFRFVLAPMLSSMNGQFVGAGSVGYLWYPTATFQEILLQADAKTFHYNETYAGLPEREYARYVKVAPGLTFRMKQDPLSSVSRTLAIKAYNIWEDTFTATGGIKTMQHSYAVLRYKHKNDRAYNPFSYSGEAQLGADFAKVSIEGQIKIDYNKPRKALYLRGYIGKFFAINGDPAITNRYLLNSSYSGINDYLYDGTYLGRNAQSKAAAQQLSGQEGGFKVPVFGRVARSDNYLATINAETDLPVPVIPLRIFVDAGIMPNYKPTYENNKSTTFLYEAGLSLSIAKDFMYIYVPIVMSGDFKDYLKDTYGSKSFGRSISFTMMFQNVNWFNFSRPALRRLGI